MKRKFHLFNCLMLRVVGAASVRWLATITVIPPLYKVPIVLSERDILFEFMIINFVPGNLIKFSNDRFGVLFLELRHLIIYHRVDEPI